MLFLPDCVSLWKVLQACALIRCSLVHSVNKFRPKILKLLHEVSFEIISVGNGVSLINRENYMKT